MRTHTFVLFVATSLAVSAGCGKDEPSKATPAPAPSAPATTTAAATTAAPAPSAAPSAAPAKAAQKVEVALATVGNTMAFDKTKLSVPAGSEVHLTLKNNATMATLPHNWVLVKTGTEATVAAGGLKLGEAAGYIDVRDKNMLAHTGLAKPGETTDVTFTAPDAGDYPFICTFPGHYMMMKGVLTVTP